MFLAELKCKFVLFAVAELLADTKHVDVELHEIGTLVQRMIDMHFIDGLERHKQLGALSFGHDWRSFRFFDEKISTDTND